MDIHDKSLITILVVSLVQVVFAVPLVFRRVPRNAVYGFRTRATMASDELWFAANAYFGQKLIVGAVLVGVLAAGTYLAFPIPRNWVLPASVLCLVLPSLISALATGRFLRRQRDLAP